MGTQKMNLSKWMLCFCSVLAASGAASAQKLNSASAARAENAALSLQLKQQKEAMEIVKQSLDALVAKVDNPTNGLEAVREKITHPTTGLEARVAKSETKVPELAISRTYCTTAGRYGCDLSCNNYAKNGDGSYRTNRDYPKKHIEKYYNTVGRVVMIGSEMQFNSQVDPNPNSSDELHRIIQLGGVDFDAGQVEANCRATQIERCAEPVKECVKRSNKCVRRSGRTCTTYECVQYAPKSCKVWKKEYIATQCEATCAAVGYRK